MWYHLKQTTFSQTFNSNIQTVDIDHIKQQNINGSNLTNDDNELVACYYWTSSFINVEGIKSCKK